MKKSFLILFVSLFASRLVDQDATFDSIKLMQLYLDKNQLDKVEDLYDDKENLLSKSWMALERLAISFERREKYKEAIETYRKIILTLNKPAHDKILGSSAKSLEPSDYEKTKLPFYYYKLALLNSQLFSKTHEYTPPLDRKKFKTSAEGFIALCRKVRCDESDLKSLEDTLEEKISVDISLVYKPSWFVSLDLMSWQDRIILARKDGGAKYNILGTSMGSCIGGGRKWENSEYEFDMEGCLAVASATVSSETTSISYQQASVPVKSFFLGPGFYTKSFSENVIIGVQVPVKYRTGEWTNPNENIYVFERSSALEVGYFLQSKIKVKNISLRTRLGKVFPNPGSLWSIGAIYDF